MLAEVEKDVKPHTSLHAGAVGEHVDKPSGVQEEEEDVHSLSENTAVGTIREGEEHHH